MIDNKQIIVFSLGENEFGFPIDSVSEIIKYVPVTSIPNSSLHVEGACNLRDKIHTILNIKSILGLDSNIYDKKSSYFIISNEFDAGVIVDEVKMIISPAVGDIVEIDTLTTHIDRQNIQYIVKDNDKLIFVLNYRDILSRSLIDTM